MSTGRIIGALFLLAFVAYGTGSALGASPTGTALVLLNSLIVGAIGILVFRALGDHHPATARTYLAARLAEAVLLAAGLVLANADIAYQTAMLALGLGSIAFCAALRQTRWVPSWMAIWGIIGYSLLAAGAIAELAGIGVGLALSVPGGLFEIVFGLTLLWRGLPEPSDRTFSRGDSIQEVVAGRPPV